MRKYQHIMLRQQLCYGDTTYGQMYNHFNLTMHYKYMVALAKPNTLLNTQLSACFKIILG